MKQKLLLLHGALGTEKQFDALKNILANDFELHSITFDGHGGKELEGNYSMDLFSKNVRDYLIKNALPPMQVFGYSMGGYVALYIAIKHPHLFQNIVTLGTKFQWDEASAAKEVKMLNPDIIEEKVPKFAEKLNQEHQPLNWKEVVNKTASMMIDLSKGSGFEWQDLKAISNKVTIGLGSEDHMVTVEESAAVAEILPNASFVTLPNVPHPIDKVDPEILANFILQNIASTNA